MILHYHPTRPVDVLETDGMTLRSGAIFAVADERARELLLALPGELSNAGRLLGTLDRDALNERARALGVRNPGKLKSKAAVIDAARAALSPTA